MAVCHTVVCDSRSKGFNGPSPDEVALVTAARNLGVEFIGKDDRDCISINC
jgi:hypothetical protein